jgi:Insect cuticle protein
VIASCLAQDYEEYESQPQQIRSSGPANPPRYFSQPKEQKAAEPNVAILKQINRHNEDGSYTYGYEASDGSFKIETKAANGEVKGKYGYTDVDGKVRVVEYGANKFGFQPSGDGITVSYEVLIRF